MMSPITGVPPIYAIVFGVYGSSKRALARGPDDPLSLMRIFIAGCITGVATTIITAPVELVKARLQVQYNAAPVPGVPTFNGPMEMAKHIVKAEGVPGLFRGTVATLWRDVPGTGIYFAVYEAVRRAFAKQAGVKPTEIGALKTLISGGCAGIGIWICMFPVDLLKSRAQTDSTGAFKPGTRGLVAAGAAIYKEAGIAGLYKGLTPCLIRSFPANAACFLAVELTMRFLNRF
jgi:solute carrier family 25 (mitochondrial carnitine/acylcarnitine transporter), member 20/29